MSKSTFDILVHLVQEQQGIDISEVPHETPLSAAGLDSLALAELMFSIDERFKLNLSDMTQPDLPSTLGGVIALIDSRIAAR